MGKVLLGAILSLSVPIGCTAQTSVLPRGCGVSPQTLEILSHLHVPDDPWQPTAERKARKLQELHNGLASSPEDIVLNEEYQDVQIGVIGDGREGVIKEYEERLAKSPQDPILLYLAARALYSWNTKQAMSDLEQALKISPLFGFPHLLLARIYSAPAFSNPAKVAGHLDRYFELCPTTVGVFPELRWSKDRELITRTAERIRMGLKGRTDIEAEAAYPSLWRLEAASQRSDDQAANRQLILSDAQQLRTKQFPRSTDWQMALEDASDMTGKPKVQDDADSEFAHLFPKSEVALELAWSERDAGNPSPTDNATPEAMQTYWKREREITLAFARQSQGAIEPASRAVTAAAHDVSATSGEVREAVDLFQFAQKQNSEDLLTAPPTPLTVAEDLVASGMRLEDVPSLVQEGLALADRMYAGRANSDLSADSAASAGTMRDTFFLYGMFPLVEAYIRMGKMPSAKDTLLQVDDRIREMRPAETASSEEISRYAGMEARFWFLKGFYAETEGRKLDALINYRNSISTFPVRRANPDRREEIMQKAQSLWQQLNGTAEGWNDWAGVSSLSNFYAGSGKGNAWSHLASVRPKLILTDALGHEWKPDDLSKKITFVTLWASWCGPCRAELPYVEKLYEHFKGREDVAVLALNIDDDPKAMDPALKELRVTLPSVAARDFAYDLVPPMALPANWIITPSKSQIFEAPSGSLELWLEKATKACEQANSQ
jgi:thiol-disulfide isomerase/thioredoxin